MGNASIYTEITSYVLYKRAENETSRIQAWFEDFVMRARSNLAEGGIEVEYVAMYEALRRTMTVADVLTIMEQEKAA